MLKDINTSKIDEILKSEAESLKKDFDISERQFAVFGYNTIFKGNTSKLEKEISKERALFPTMNPNLFGGLPSIFSCKPGLRVKLNPGDVIFCFPNKTKKIKGDKNENNKDETIMKKYFKDRGKEPPERCLTLVMIVIKKIDLKHIPNALSFKYCKEKRNVTKYPDCEYIPQFADDLRQAGDITVDFQCNSFYYTGDLKSPHRETRIKKITIKSENIRFLNKEKDCPYSRRLLEEDFFELPCNKVFKCDHFFKNKSALDKCYMKDGIWKYDLICKKGLLGSLKKSIPLEFRSFYLGSEGWALERFAEEINAPEILKNIRYKKYISNEKGAGVLNKLRIEHKIQ